MAKQKGILKIEGLLDGLSFYSSVYGDIVRRKGGASKEKIRKSPAFKRLREHHAEFSGCAKAGKLLRQALAPYTKYCPDHSMVWRVTKLMNQLKDQDHTSARGKRKVNRGLSKAEGKDVMTGFDFNRQAPLKDVLKKTIRCKGGTIRIDGFMAKKDLSAAKGSTHVQFTGIVLDIDFQKGKHALSDESIELSLNQKATDLLLKPKKTGAVGIQIYLLQICFMQEVNGKLYALENKQNNSLGILGVL